MPDDLIVRVAVLEKMVDQLLSTIASARVAEKTAEKALSMAQEALILISSSQKQAQVSVDPFEEGVSSDFSQEKTIKPVPLSEDSTPSRVNGIYQRLMQKKYKSPDFEEPKETEANGAAVEEANDLVEALE